MINSTLTIEAFAPRQPTKGLYKLEGVSSHQRPEINSLRFSSKVALWHKRLGHFHTRGLQCMINSTAVKGLPPLQFTKHTCSSCQLGKQARSKMPKETTHHASKILELIHSDVCGPFRVQSTGGAKFFVTFVDDFQKKSGSILFRTKAMSWLNSSNSSTSLKTLQENVYMHFEQTMVESTRRKPSMISVPPKASLANSSRLTRHGVAERQNRSLTSQDVSSLTNHFLAIFGVKPSKL